MFIIAYMHHKKNLVNFDEKPIPPHKPHPEKQNIWSGDVWVVPKPLVQSKAAVIFPLHERIKKNLPTQREQEGFFI